MIHLSATGSIAAIIQSLIGNVAAGSWFACLQFAGTAPLLLAKIGAIVGAAVGIVGHPESDRSLVEWQMRLD